MDNDMMQTDLPEDVWKYIQDRSGQLKQDQAERVLLCEEMEQAFFLEWSDEKRVQELSKNIKITKSPDLRNHVLGAMRLLIATDPEFGVKFDSNEREAIKQSPKLEKAAKEMLLAAGRAAERPIHYDVVMSMLIYDEVQMLITRSQDMVDYQSGTSVNKAARYHAEEIARKAPYLVDVVNPKNGFPDVGKGAMRAYYREVGTTAGDIWDEFGEAGRMAASGNNRYAAHTLCTWWDYEWHVVWVLGGRRVLAEKHGLPFIPVICRVGQGTKLFEEVKHQRHPFLYTAVKSGLWDRMNLMLTSQSTNVLAFLANPTFYYRRGQAGKEIDVDMNTAGFIVNLDPGEEFGSVEKRVIDPEAAGLLDKLEQKVEESTIYTQALGQPLSGNAPFSLVALLSQAGRLPLLVPQRASGFALSDVMKVIIRWLKAEPIDGEYDYENLMGGLDIGMIPEHFELNCKLDIALPQDKLQAANIAKMLAQPGPSGPLVPMRWIREEILNMGQSEDIDREIHDEIALWSEMQRIFQWLAMMDDMRKQQAQQSMTAGAGGGVVPGGGGQVPSGPPPEAGPPPPNGEPTVQGMPEEMATGGMMAGDTGGGGQMAPPEGM